MNTKYFSSLRIIFLAIIVVLFAALLYAQQNLTLDQAIAKGLVTARISGTGASSGDAIRITIQKTTKAGAGTLVMDVPPGAMLRSTNRSEQNMVVAGVRGRAIDARSFAPMQKIVVSGASAVTYVLEAYCAEFHKANPSASTGFSIAHFQPNLACVLQEGQKRGLSTSALQAAVWIVTDNVTYSRMNSRLPLSRQEWEAGEAVARDCRQAARAQRTPQRKDISEAEGLLRKAKQLWGQKNYTGSIEAANKALTIKRNNLGQNHQEVREIEEMIETAQKMRQAEGSKEETTAPKLEKEFGDMTVGTPAQHDVPRGGETHWDIFHYFYPDAKLPYIATYVLGLKGEGSGETHWDIFHYLAPKLPYNATYLLGLKGENICFVAHVLPQKNEKAERIAALFGKPDNIVKEQALSFSQLEPFPSMQTVKGDVWQYGPLKVMFQAGAAEYMWMEVEARDSKTSESLGVPGARVGLPGKPLQLPSAFKCPLGTLFSVELPSAAMRVYGTRTRFIGFDGKVTGKTDCREETYPRSPEEQPLWLVFSADDSAGVAIFVDEDEYTIMVDGREIRCLGSDVTEGEFAVGIYNINCQHKAKRGYRRILFVIPRKAKEITLRHRPKEGDASEVHFKLPQDKATTRK